MPRVCAEVWRESTKLVLFAIVLFAHGFRRLAGPTMVTIWWSTFEQFDLDGASRLIVGYVHAAGW